MIARASSVEPFLLLACLLGALVLVVWFHLRRKHPATREPQDLSAMFADTFIIKPYIQLGDYSRQLGSEQFEVMWHSKPQTGRSWTVQARVRGESGWRAPVRATSRVLTISAIGESERSVATLTGLPLGVEVEYRVLCDGDIAFGGTMRTRNSRDQAFRFAVAGDLGEPTSGHEQKIAYEIYRSAPNFLVVPGDIVYERGRVAEYMRNFFPVYNADVPTPTGGAPILRSMLVMGAAGNHDMGMPKAMLRRNFTRYPDLLGYYLFFSQPLNGPGTAGGANTPVIEGDEAAQKLFIDAAGNRYPRMASFSFDWGSSHWLILDANAYMDWTDAELRDWVAKDLDNARDATWRFVTFHQPAFSSDGKHVNEQRMRLLAPIFQEHGVDVVFVGHVHCYERTHPLRFVPDKMETKLHTEDCAVEGKFEIDTRYNGVDQTRPDGVIYVTSGAGGAVIHRDSDPVLYHGGLKPYTAKYDQKVHSFTVCDLDGRRLVLRQINEDGDEIDHFVIDK